MNKKLFLATTGLLLLMLSFSAFAVDVDLETTLATRFSRVWYIAPQEKVYLHTDKPYYYSAGEDIWFRAHLVNAATHIPNTQSQFVYVELIDGSNSVLSRVKLRRDSAGIAGKISIAPEIQPGEYLLRAYTYWMQNVSTDYFFHKRIFIGNMIDDRVQINTVFGEVVNGKIPLSITFSNTFSSPLSEKQITINKNYIKSNRHTENFITNQQGEIHLLIEKDNMSELHKVIDVSINEPGLAFNRKIKVPDASDDYDVQFFPESGTFLDNQIQTVAFKAIGVDGLSVKITGKILNRENNEVAEIRCSHNGMGRTTIKTMPGEKYVALVVNESGVEKRIDLPEVRSKGVGLKMNSIRDVLYFEILNQSDLPTEELFLTIHSRGVVYYVLPINNPEGMLSENLFPPGICSFSIIDASGNTYCERTWFIKGNKFPVLSMNTHKERYKKREAVELSFNMLSSDSLPVRGSFSVSVTDSHLVKQDSINNNILSYLLLNSDVKGYIEEPQQYFQDNSASTKEKTNILMLTQGWTRFNTSEIIRGVFPTINYFLEAGQFISGKVLNLFRNPVKDSEIALYSDYYDQFLSTKTDTAGVFFIDGVDLPDSTYVMLKAQSRSKIVDVEIIPDKEIFPSNETNIPFANDNTLSIHEDYMLQAKENYYNEGGMLIVNLDEITVKAEERKPINEYFFSGAAETMINAKTIESFTNQTALNIIQTLPGVMVFGNRVSVRGASANPLFLIDGIETDDIDRVQFLFGSDIEEIMLFKGPSTALFGSRGSNGVIAITLKKSVAAEKSRPPSFVLYSPLGYQKPTEFYVPKYDVDSTLNQMKPDLRTTIHWEPKAQTDEEGNIRLMFYTADKPNDYRVELEGITESGEICKFMGIIKRD